MDMRFKPLAAALLLLALPLQAQAGERVASVVELFTSQGCSSCPPADALAGRLADEPGTLVLSWHVDYWDYLGWKDTLGLAQSAERQNAYAAAFKARSVYTPQAVVNGASGVVGSDETAVRSALDARALPPLAASMARTPGRIAITLPHLALDGAEAVLELVWFEASSPVAIARGENAGKTVAYRNTVRASALLGIWRGEPRTIEMPEQQVEGLACALLVRRMLPSGQPGEILAAAVAGPQG